MDYKSKNIIFTDCIGVPKEFSPKLATQLTPDWYKSMPSYIDGNKKPSGEGTTSATIKKCMPVFDAFSCGYILLTYVDVFVTQKITKYNDRAYLEKTGKNKPLTKAQIQKRGLRKTNPYYEWPSYKPIEFHDITQAPTYPNNPGHLLYPKWINPWSIKTPPGYSVLFLPPMHQSSVFKILEGVVDTDSYTAPVNFPFVLNDINFEGLIPAGTPMAQVIPFKRESWKMSIGDEKDMGEQFKITVSLRTKFFDSYKTKFRANKEFK